MKFFDSPVMRETLHRLLRSQMALKGVDYNELSNRLAQLGVAQTATNLRSKINQGTLGAQLFLFIQFALGVKHLDLANIGSIYQDVELDLKDPQGTDRALVESLTGASLAQDQPHISN